MNYLPLDWCEGQTYRAAVAFLQSMLLPLPSTSFSASYTTSNTTSSTQQKDSFSKNSNKNINTYLLSYFENLRILGWNVPQTSIIKMEHSLRLHCFSVLNKSEKIEIKNQFTNTENVENQNFWMKVFLSIFSDRLKIWPSSNFIFMFSSSLPSISSFSSFSSKNDLIIAGKQFQDSQIVKNNSKNHFQSLGYEDDIAHINSNNNNNNNNTVNDNNNNNCNNNTISNEIRNSKKRSNTEFEIGNMSDHKNENREKKEKRKAEERQRKKENQERIKLEIFEMERDTNTYIENKRKKEENYNTNNFTNSNNVNINNYENSHYENNNNNNNGVKNNNLSTLHNVLGIFDFERNASDKLVRTLQIAINQNILPTTSLKSNSLHVTDLQSGGSGRNFGNKNLFVGDDGNENESKKESKNENKTNDIDLFLLSCQNEKKKFQNLLNLVGVPRSSTYVQK